jgi:hypothetical protein
VKRYIFYIPKELAYIRNTRNTKTGQSIFKRSWHSGQQKTIYNRMGAAQQLDLLHWINMIVVSSESTILQRYITSVAIKPRMTALLTEITRLPC